MTNERKFIYRPIQARVNFDAMRLLQISCEEYLFLDLINQFQDKSGTGWAELNKANNYTKISDFKISLGAYVGLKERSMYNVFKNMKEKGYIEEKVNGFRVTENFWILKGEGEREGYNKSMAAPSVSKPNDGKMFFSDSPLSEFEAFKTAVLVSLPNETDLDFAAYFKEITVYYTSENTKAYKNWEIKIADWIKRQIKDGDVKRVTDKTKSNRTTEELLQDLRNGYKSIRTVDENTEFKAFKDKVINYIDDAKEAESRLILPEVVKTEVDTLQTLMNERGGLLRQLNTLKEDFRALQRGANDS